MEEKKFIDLKNKTNVLVFHLRTEDGKETGETLKFNLKDIELLGRYDEMFSQLKKNDEWYRNQKVIIDKKQEIKGKNDFLSNKQKMLYEASKEYLKKQAKAFDLFLGNGGVEKLLNHDTLDMDSIAIIKEYIDKQILPCLEITEENISKEIKEKYKIDIKEEVLE